MCNFYFKTSKIIVLAFFLIAVFSFNTYAVPVTWQSMSYSTISTVGDNPNIRAQDSSQNPTDSLPIGSSATYSYTQSFPYVASGSGSATATAQNGLLTGSSSTNGKFLTSTNTTAFHGETFSDIYNIVNLNISNWSYQLNGGEFGDVGTYLSYGLASTNFDVDITNMDTSANIFHYSQTRIGPSVHPFGGYMGPLNGTETFLWNVTVPYQANLAIDITLHDSAYHYDDFFDAFASTSTSLSYLIDGNFDSSLLSNPDAPVPEPSTFILLFCSFAGVGILRKKIFK